MSLLVSGYAVRLYEAFSPVYLSLAVITASTKSYPESLFIAILPVPSTLTSASELSYIMLLSYLQLRFSPFHDFLFLSVTPATRSPLFSIITLLS